MKKIYRLLVFTLGIILIFSMAYYFINKLKSPVDIVKDFNDTITLKEIVKEIDEDNKIKLIIWKDNNSDIIVSILEKNNINLWKVIGQCGVVPTNSNNIDQFSYGKVFFRNTSNKDEGLFIGYINNIENYNITKVTVNNKDATIINDNKNYIWYSWGTFEYFNKEAIKIYRDDNIQINN